MIFCETKIKGLYVVEPEMKTDTRGCFFRFFCKKEFSENGLDFDIVQANRSITESKGTIRGLHFQKDHKSEDKLVGCLKGKVFDVAVDLRRNSQTYGQWVGQELSAENNKMLLIPKGFAHGYQALADDCEMLYFMSEFYSPDHASGVRWDDKFFGIDWPIAKPFLSESDKNWPLVKL